MSEKRTWAEKEAVERKEGKRDTGGHFYPNKNDKGAEWSDGITRRDWLAGLAMQGILSNPTNNSHQIQVDLCYAVADAVIAEGNK